MDTATTMFPHRTAPIQRSTLPRHIWSNSVRHDVAKIRRRAKAIRRLVGLDCNSQRATVEDVPSSPSHICFWSGVNTPLPLRTVLSPSPGVSTPSASSPEKELYPDRDIPPSQVLQACFKGLRQMIR